MVKKIIKFTGIVLLIGFISIFIRGYKYHETKTIQNEDKMLTIQSEDKQNIIDEEVITSLLNNDDSNKNLEVSTTQEQTLNVAKETKNEDKPKVSNSQPIKEVPISESNSEWLLQKDTEKPKTPTTSEDNVVEDTKKQEIWEVLGMSKDQYYNQPLYSWERIDFKTYDECTAYGDKYLQSINGETNYVCREVTSMSGRFLGIMFDTEKTN